MVIESDLPLSFMNLVVVPGAQRDEFVEVGGSAVFPEGDVVDLAVVEGDITPGAGGVHSCQGGSLGVAGGTAGSSDIERYSVLGEGDGGDGGITQVATNRLEWEVESVAGVGLGSSVGPRSEGGLVDDKVDVGPALSGGVTGEELIESDRPVVIIEMERFPGEFAACSQRSGLSIQSMEESGPGFGVEVDTGMNPAITAPPGPDPVGITFRGCVGCAGIGNGVAEASNPLSELAGPVTGCLGSDRSVTGIEGSNPLWIVP